MRRLVLWLAMGFAFAGRNTTAQEIDTVILNSPAKQFTVLDQIESPEERRDFVALYKANQPLARHTLAEQFMRDHAQSWLLPEVFEAAAKASIDLGEYRRAMQEARFSLRLLPENPLLLVPLANVEAQQSELAAAQQDARDALEYLQLFARPGGIGERDWNIMLPQLEASANFVLGRVYATRGLGVAGSSRSTLVQAAEFLTTAARLNPGDPEIFYLRGVVESALQRPVQAADDFRIAGREGSPFRSLALDQLSKISAAQPNRGAGFESPVGQTTPPPALQPTFSKPNQDSGTAKYAGSGACKTCHAHEFGSWRKTGMARMLRPYQPENIRGDFSAGTNFHDEKGRVSIRLGTDARPYFDVLGEDGRWSRFHVDYTIGSKWQQGYAARLPDGRLHVLPIEYNSIQKAWINYWAIIDLPGSERARVSNFPKFLASTNYQRNCAICHTSQLKAAATDETSMENASFREPGIDCEMCHGPSEQHVERMQSGQVVTRKALDPPVDFPNLSNREAVRICAQCHRQSAIRDVGSHNELNYSTNGQSFVLATKSRPYGEFGRRAFYKDGRFRETTFIVEAFTRSACYRKGPAQCASCHDPHPANPEQNLTSLKFKDRPDRMCLQCHPKYERSIEKHTHHAASSNASRCVSCHMPRIANSVMFKARSHQIDDIPSIDLTERFGQQESPNACLMCHAERNFAWVRDKLAHW